MSDLAIELLGKQRDFHCACGCKQIHRQMSGKATRVSLDQTVVFFAMLASHKNARKLWLTIGAGPRPGEERDAFVSVEVWRNDDQVISRVTEPAECPWRANPLFKDLARLLGRSEVFGQAGMKAWLFLWVDQLIQQIAELNRFIASADGS